MGSPAGGPGRNGDGPVWGFGGGVCGGPGVDGVPPGPVNAGGVEGDVGGALIGGLAGVDEGKPVRGSVGADEGSPLRGSTWGCVVGRPVRGSMVDCAPTGGAGACGVVEPVWASTGAAASIAAPRVSIVIRGRVIANLLSFRSSSVSACADR
jgi:hypothetical protein